MADEQYRWLDSDTAERLLSGESPDVVEPADRERAARLAHTLGSLTPPGPQDGAELPGEAAALAAFRKVRAEGFAGAPVGDAGEVGDVVQLGVPVVSAGVSRRQRAARFGLAAVLALGVAGGAAVVAGGSGTPEPGATVSAAATPTPGESQGGTPVPEPGVSAEGVVPDGGGAGGTTGGAPSGGAGGSAVSGGSGASGGTTSGGDGGKGAQENEALGTTCRDLALGRSVDGARRRSLEGAAGGAAKVPAYCAGVLQGDKGDKG
ncbi:hypothetical protein, partial [Streptomyces acidiscabies]